MLQHEPDYGKLVKNLKQIGPTGVSLPPSIQAYVDYSTNYSWWKERMMYTERQGKTFDWPQSAIEGKLNDPSVSELAKNVGGVTGLSPKRLQGAISNVIPSNNEFVQLFGYAYEQAFSDLPKEMRQQHWLQTLANFPGINRIIGVTQPNYDRQQTANEIVNDDEFKRVVRDGQFDMMATQYAWHGVNTFDQLNKFMKDQDYDTYKDMESKLRFIEKTKDLPNRSMWLRMWHYNPEVKAREFDQTYEAASPAEKRQLDIEFGQVMRIGGYVTKEFMAAHQKIINDRVTKTGVKK
jgi:hypothetical protein